ncbi:hypothetical protein GF358_00785 [Candidatus Woesearchaeota archaeon]|nr:hypothetical protein [Candidatus Woesearchaeota archaeon]
MNKKAQGLTITTVVVAVLAILVLVVLFYIFTTKTGGLSRQLITCPGDCANSEEACIKYGGIAVPTETAGKYITSNGNTCPVCCSVRLPTGAPELVE